MLRQERGARALACGRSINRAHVAAAQSEYSLGSASGRARRGMQTCCNMTAPCNTSVSSAGDLAPSRTCFACRRHVKSLCVHPRTRHSAPSAPILISRHRRSSRPRLSRFRLTAAFSAAHVDQKASDVPTLQRRHVPDEREKLLRL